MTSPSSYAKYFCLLLPLSIWAGAASGGTCDSPDAPMVYPWTDPSTYARPARVLPPEYPAEQLKKGITAKVEASLRIDENGAVKEVLSIKADSGETAFENAVREAVGQWKFTHFIDCQCTPVEFTSRQIVWFEIRDGQPAISVSRGEDPPRRYTNKKPLKYLNGAEVYKAVSESFPRKARRASQGGVVFALSTVNPQTGEVEKIDIKHVDARADLRHYFSEAAKWALSKARYELTEADKPPIQACITVEYRIQR